MGKTEEYVVQAGFAHRDGHRVGCPAVQGAQHAGELAGTGSGPDLDVGAVALRPVACRSQRHLGGLSGLLPAKIQVEDYRAEPGLQLGGVPLSATRPAEMIIT